MYTTASTFKLKPGCYAEYKKAHDELWPELAQSFRQHDISMVIHYYEDRLFLFATAPSEQHMEDSHPKEIGAKWHAYMATLMVTDESGESIVEDLEQAFAFGAFA
ncbi:MAG: L-rhamnose mutarotase [Gemmatimonadetes bacterium]|jgi:L-rhamnose mutarotase|nr:L-rhamnose mutarotase [Gemmatimonadota bacterium]MBT5143172.1 L-rhamnose mutarotase [Gemmatimonadota bacterium]MBT5590758.1 L-rhamnose mutarotase [Gemmatimonadota bacterium]MBT5963587.1 L-rhamnose mutarotase [Gemmatimonadota bacterium]MBT7457744.1 L-rhamnose mutarotase [Gemmatimonadota bacterium]